ncbi:hypothetical protein TeGR_g3126 [Tetraparma gracilis]|uniref:Uncharacterized protein n=1 Tax=Tetraparma gracilis TaxID=2962635 RepID=A0ABQ6MQD4_9STRA|nr:hypothetical protein TeGR_g3126 [Tetraparma gracilis]
MDPRDFFRSMFAEGQTHRLSKCAPLLSEYNSCLGLREAALSTPPPAASWFGAAPPPSVEPPSCNRQAHNLWSCRANAVGCGSELKFLKKCRQESKGGGECRDEQRKMGDCVVKKMEELRAHQQVIDAKNAKE